MILIQLEIPKIKVTDKDLQSSVDKALDALQEFAKDRITQKANERLSRLQAQNYLRGLSQPGSFRRGMQELTITLLGQLPNSLESGITPYDIKAMMLAKAKKFTKKGKPIVDVPFKHVSSKPTFKPNLNVATDAKKIGVKSDKKDSGIRRISENSKPDSWLHPGSKGLDIFTEVAKEIDDVGPKVIEKALK